MEQGKPSKQVDNETALKGCDELRRVKFQKQTYADFAVVDIVNLNEVRRRAQANKSLNLAKRLPFQALNRGRVCSIHPSRIFLGKLKLSTTKYFNIHANTHNNIEDSDLLTSSLLMTSTFVVCPIDRQLAPASFVARATAPSTPSSLDHPRSSNSKSPSS
jgi:hypothetical protein